jgi:hypothetical protein
MKRSIIENKVVASIVPVFAAGLMSKIDIY